MKALRLRQLGFEAHARLPSLYFSRKPTSSRFALSSALRAYATHRDPVPSSLLSQALDQKQGTTRRDTVGPFNLGPSQSKADGNVKKWSELSTGGKVLRTTARTSNFTVILFGAGLTGVLVYALTSELFSKNSPTVLYNDACERIKASSQVAKYLQGPLIFHNNPPSVLRPRHRNRHVSSQIAVDQSGKEHMLLNFYVQARPPGATPDSSESYIDMALLWTKDIADSLGDLTWDGAVVMSKEHAAHVAESAKELFRYLTGDPVAPKSMTAEMGPESRGRESPKEENRSMWGNITGLFGSLKGASRTRVEEARMDSVRQVWQEGEVHAELIRDDLGYFVFRYILIDIPSSNSRNPVRVFVERSVGVRENEPVMKWDT